MSNELKNRKVTLAKLLAGENISVQHKKVSTASFDVKNRVLTIPIYKKDISEDVYDVFVAHEVGHALWTPNDESIFEDKKLFPYINLVEDVRIEKRIKNKFGGLNKSFSRGYSELWNDGFFGVTESDVPTLSFADKLNLNAKIGLPIEFTPEEQDLVDRSKAVISFSEVVELAKEIRAFCKDEQKEDEENGQEKNDECEREEDNSDENCPGGGIDGYNEDVKDENSDNSDDSESTDDSDNSDEDKKETGKTNDGDNNSSEKKNKSDSGDSTAANEKVGEDEEDDFNEDDILKTQKNFDESVEDTIDEKAHNPKYLKIPTFDLSKVIIPHNIVLEEVTKCKNNFADIGSAFNSFKKDNLQVVNHLVKQFELKKAAEIHKRAAESKSGTLDVNKIYRYSYDDNIFKRNTTLPEGKNHGLVIFLDWSGSMSDKILATVQQTLNLVFFCKKAGIAFDVYGFIESARNHAGNLISDRSESVNQSFIDSGVEDLLLPNNHIKLVQFLSSSQRAADFNKSAENLFWLGSSFYKSPYSVASTPLNSALVVAPQVIKEFRQKTKAQVVHLVVLTDGIASDYSVNYTEDKSKRYYTGVSNVRASRNVIITKGTKNYSSIGEDKRWDTNANRRGNTFTIGLLEYIKDVCGVSITGFFLTPRGSTNVSKEALYNYAPDRYEWSNINKDGETFKKDKSLTITDCGYDELHYISAKRRDLSTDDEDYFEGEANEDVKIAVREVKSAFNKIGKERNKKRVVLNRFIDLISKPKNIV